MSLKSLSIIKNWFTTGAKPTQEQFHDWLDSFWHKNDEIAIDNIAGLDDILTAVQTTVNNFVAGRRYGSVAILEAGTTITLSSSYPPGTNYIILCRCRNENGDVGYQITEQTPTGFTVTPDLDATFEYETIKII